MHDVDWVAVPEARPPRKGGKCTIKAPPGPPTVAELRLIDHEVIIVERKTARVIERRTFAAVTDCPSFVSGAAAETSPDETEIKRWLRDERAKP